MLVLGLDPGLQRTGWGVVRYQRGVLSYVASGVVSSIAKADTASRLLQIYQGLQTILEAWQPETAAVEETFVNANATSTLKLGLARGVVLLAPAAYGISVAEYTANQVKKSVTGAGHAGKEQVQAMVQRLLPGLNQQPLAPDAADALAIAICHSHMGGHMGAGHMGGGHSYKK
ncbi:MAG: crossover junction endodeoxyribonuclease RuvC [Alphaproteobacteria bacterium]